MKGLYKGRYIIAVYDNEDNLLEVETKAEDLKFVNGNGLGRRKNGDNSKYKVYLIDALEKHDDIFQEEDKIFLESIKTEQKMTNKDQAYNLGISLRQFYYKRKAMGEVNGRLENKR